MYRVTLCSENSEVAALCKISAMPTFKVFKNKKECGMVRGADEGGLRKLVAKHTGGGGGDSGAGGEPEKRADACCTIS